MNRLWDRLASRFVPPALAEDLEARRQALMVIGLALSPIPISPAIAAVYYFTVDPAIAGELAIGILAVAPMFLVIPFVLRSTGSIALSTHATCAYVFVLLAVLSLLTGGPRAPALYWLPLLPVGVLGALGVRAGAIWGGLVGLWFAVIFVAWQSGVHFRDFVLPDRQPWLWFGCMSGLLVMQCMLIAIYDRAKNDAVVHLAAANVALELARDEAQEASQSKSEFLANMSHEVRTPMTAIMGFTDVLLAEAESQPVPGSWSESLGIVRRNGEHLMAILNDILDLSKVEAGRLVLEQIEFSLPQLIKDVLELMSARASEKSLELDVQLAGPIPANLRGDPTRLRQVLLNLIGNATKFTDVGSVTLLIGAEQGAFGKRIWFTVRDTGIGMTPDQLEHIFEPFSQADGSTTRKYGGTGLGLAISRRLVRKMGGEIEAESTPNVGTQLRFYLPVEQDAEVCWVERLDVSDGSADRKPRSTVGRVLKGRVLFADDGADNRRLVSHVLRRAGLQVTVVENGKEAVERAREAQGAGESFDVILLDMQMPVLDGYQATRALRDGGYVGPIAALTANAMQGDRERCLAEGCDEFLTKPIVIPRLLETLAHMLDRGHQVKPTTTV